MANECCGIVVGIDLGTTYSYVAILTCGGIGEREKKPEANLWTGVSV